ncbi:MAG: hypothetical protein R3D25_14035 [Geminicoccaceae bacterium]
MSGFAADWLALREPYDHAARSPDLFRRLAAWAAGRPQLRVVDLGSGTGSNLRATAPALACPQAWTLVEHDPALIAAGTSALARLPAKVTASYAGLDLARDLAAAIPPGTDLVTASAFLDLASEAWLDELVARVRAHRAALHVVLTFDGSLRWRPGDIFDGEVKRLFEAHQRTDKGFGPALGPAAVAALEKRLGTAGGELHVAASDWRLGYADQAIQEALLEGYARAATETDPGQSAEIADWQAQRGRQIDAGRSEHRVGHKDVLWIPD